jgi:hypothetical protein
LKTISPFSHFLLENDFPVLDQQLSWPEGCWWTEYYAPLQQRINQIKESRDGSHHIEDIGAIEAEIRLVAAHPRDSDCAHYILVKDVIRQ